MDRILIVDDDIDLCELLTERLSTEDFQLEAMYDGLQGLDRSLSQEYALVILDLMLPGLSGLDVLRRLRAKSDVPVLILTARGEDIERIVGLEIGADDYLAKPFNPRELIARIRAILRRSVRAASTVSPLIAGDIRLDPSAREAWLSGRQLGLTSVEFTLLEALVTDAGRVLSRDRLTEIVLGRKLGPFDRVIDVHISNLRKKLGTLHEAERIKAVRGSGYIFVVRTKTL
jgi:DNA-binding response OmpR family regulator